MPAPPDARTMKQEVRTLRKYLREMIAMDRGVIAAMDAEMKRPSDPERGRRIARIVNALAFSADMAERYGLNIQTERTPSKRIGPAVNRRQPHAD